MESMKQIALTTPLTRMGVYDETGRPESIAVSVNSTQEQRAKYRDEIKQINTYTSTYNH